MNSIFFKIWIVLYSIKVIPFVYAFVYELFKKLPFPDFIERLSMLIYIPPVLLGEYFGLPWLIKSAYEPSTIGIVLSLGFWFILDAGIAYLVSLFFK